MGNLTKDTIEERIASVKTSSDIDDLDLAGDLAVAGQLYCSGTGNTRQALKVHNHLTTSAIGGAEIKGEMITTTGSMYGVANIWDYTPTGATAGPTGVQAAVDNLTLPSGSTVTAGMFMGSQSSSVINGTLNGAAILEFGAVGVVAGAGTRTLVSHTAPLASLLQVTSGKEPATGELSNIYCENGFGGTADNVIYVADSAKTTNVLNFEEASGCVVNTATGNSAFVPNNKGTFTQAGQLRIKIGNDTFYIPYGTVA